MKAQKCRLIGFNNTNEPFYTWLFKFYRLQIVENLAYDRKLLDNFKHTRPLFHVNILINTQTMTNTHLMTRQVHSLERRGIILYSTKL